MRVLVITMLLLSFPAAAKDIYFADLVKKPEYKQKWNRIITGHKFRKYDSWILKHNGLRGPVSIVSIGGEKYYKDEGCEPHDCTDNSTVILANTKTYEIYMVHRVITFPDRKVSFDYFGNPSEELKSSMSSYLPKI